MLCTPMWVDWRQTPFAGFSCRGASCKLDLRGFMWVVDCPGWNTEFRYCFVQPWRLLRLSLQLLWVCMSCALLRSFLCALCACILAFQGYRSQHAIHSGLAL